MNKISKISYVLLLSLTLTLSPLLSQNAYAYTISSAVISDPDNGNTVVDANDIILIDFGLATNATAGGSMTNGELTANFTSSGSLLTGATAEWKTAAGVNSNQFLRITGFTAGSVGDTITYALSATDGGIMEAANLANEADNTAITTTGNFGIVSSSSSSNSGGGSGCAGDCEEPTLGVDSNNIRQVTNGFTYNGYSVDVERYFTPYPLITANVGKTNVAEFKIYENLGLQNIRHFTFAFGMDKGDIISNSKAKIDLDIAFDGTETVTVTDPENALDNIKVTTDTVACMDDSNSECLLVKIQHRFRAPLEFNIVGTDVWDTKRSSWQNYYNHGIEVVGESLNPPKEFNGIDKGHVYHLITTSKTTAVDEFGDSWTFQYGKWSKDYIKQDRIQDGETLVFDRMHSDFTSYKANLSDEAFNQLTQMCPLCVEQYADFDDSTTWEYGNKISKLSDSEIQNITSMENQRAQEILKYIMDPKLSSTEKYKALVELEKDERPISEILAEERMMKDILQAERHWLKQVIAPNQ